MRWKIRTMRTASEFGDGILHASILSKSLDPSHKSFVQSLPEMPASESISFHGPYASRKTTEAHNLHAPLHAVHEDHELPGEARDAAQAHQPHQPHLLMAMMPGTRQTVTKLVAIKYLRWRGRHTLLHYCRLLYCHQNASMDAIFQETHICLMRGWFATRINRPHRPHGRQDAGVEVPRQPRRARIRSAPRDIALRQRGATLLTLYSN